jgi:hypothetical protein
MTISSTATIFALFSLRRRTRRPWSRLAKELRTPSPARSRGGLIVSDIVAAHEHIVASGIEATEVFHGSPFSPEARISGPDPERKSYSSYVAFQDPDGNAWIVQEVTQRAPGRELPK